MGEDYSRFGAAVSAGQIDRGACREVSQKRNNCQLGEGPGVGYSDQDIDTVIFELAGHLIGLLLPVDQNIGVDHFKRRPIRHF